MPSFFAAMRTIIPLLSLIAILLFSGCASVRTEDPTSLYNFSRYTALEELMERRIPQLSSARTTDLYLLCEAYSQLKRYNKLFPCLEQMDLNIKQGDREASIGAKFDSSYAPPLLRAQAYLELGNYANAIREGKKAYDIATRIADGSSSDFPAAMGKLRALGLLVLAHVFSGDRVQALQYAALLEKAEPSKNYSEFLQLIFLGHAFTESGYGYEKTVYVTELAKSYMALGEFGKAYEAANSAGAYHAWLMSDRELTESGKKYIPGYAWAVFFGVREEESRFSFIELPKRFILYKSSYETGRVKEAKEGYDQLLKLPGTESNGEIYWMILFDRGRIAEGEGNLKDAIEFYKRAIDVIEHQRSTINTEASKIGFVGNKQQVYHQLTAVLVSDSQHAMAFEYVERSKARALVDLLASKKEFASPTGTQEEINRLLKELEKVETERIVQATIEDSSQVSHRRSHELQIKDQLQAAAPELASLVTVTKVSAKEIQSRLRDDETILEYYYQGDDLYAFVVTKNSVKAVQLNGANLHAEVSQFRETLADLRSRQYLALSQSLYARLIKPIEPLLETKDLVIVSHGALHYLPFGALKVEEGYLIDRYRLSHLPSASVVNYLKSRPGPKVGQMLAFGNPDLGDPKSDLKFAQDEVFTIAKTFPRTKVLIRKDATKTAFKTFGTQFPYLHFATHGKFDPDAPLNSGLLLAPDPQSDGFLSVGDLYSLRLNADLVTLSACETGLGKINHGDDVVGLARGFLYAGAQAIVASLWEVDDRATSALMAEFYANLQKTSKGEALRQAQLATKKKYAHPYYWAAFQLIGLAN